jgi:photosystem II stability/assembly factor-like uncharacterized protein
MITGTAGVTFSHDGGRTLVGSDVQLHGIQYTYGVAALDVPGTFLAWQGDDVIRTNDNGCHWDLVATVKDPEIFPPRIVAAKGGRAYAWSDNRSFTMRYDANGLTKLKQPVAFAGFGVNPANADHIRGGGIDGTVWQSEDAGATWTQLGNLHTDTDTPWIYRMAFDPDDLDHIVAGTLASGAYYTYDGGRIWRKSAGLGTEKSTNAFNLVISPANGDVVWAMALDMKEGDSGSPTHGRHILMSTDGGQSFRSVLDESDGINLINGPVMAAHPRDPNVLYFVFGTYFQGYGTDIYRYDAATSTLTTTHNNQHDINAIEFSPIDPTLMYFGLEREEVSR